MTIDPSAVARVLGISTTYKDLRQGGVLFLPQRIAVFAQGSSSSTYPSTKFQVTGAGQVGALMGYGSPAHLTVRELLPENGDGVGTIPVTVYPLSDHASGVAATGDVTPSGTQATQAAYRLRISGIQSNQFVVPEGAIDVTYICAELGKAVSAIQHMPVNVVYEYDTVTSTPDGGNTGDGTLATLSVTGSPLPGDYTLTCNTAAVDGGTFTLTDPDGTVVSTSVGVTGAPQAVGGITFTLSDGAADFIVGDTFTITVPATKTNLVSKWQGASANGILIEVLGDTTLGTTFAVTQPTGGLVNPTVDSALTQVGNIWETLALNALDGADTTALDTFQTWGEGRWGQLVRKPLVVFRGATDSTVAAATAIPAARTDDRINVQLVAPGSPNLPFVVAARQVARIAKLANSNPPHDYGSQRATGLLPGLDSEQWTFAQRDQAVKAGSSTVEVKDGVVNISDVVTHYAPVGEPIPAYRYVVDIIKLQQVIFNLDLIFAAAEWDGAPLIPDPDPTTNPAAKKPRMAKTAVNNMLRSLGLNAIISNAAGAAEATTANINAQNPKRLDVGVTVQLSGNTNIKDVGLNFGFFFGSAAAA